MKQLIKKIIQRGIVSYLKRVGEVFHYGPYATPKGKYVVLMSEVAYHDFMNRTLVEEVIDE